MGMCNGCDILHAYRIIILAGKVIYVTAIEIISYFNGIMKLKIIRYSIFLFGECNLLILLLL